MKHSSMTFAVVTLLASHLLAVPPAWHGTAAKLPDWALPDYRGKDWQPSDFADRQVLVVVFFGTECPLAKLYAPRLSSLATEYAPRGVAFVGINSNQQDSLAEIAHFAREHRLEIPLLKDPGNLVADQFGANRTPEVFVFDRARQLQYHGRIDDQYTYGVQRPKVEHQYVREALDALLAGEEPKIFETEAVGCLIGRVREPDPDSDVTYSRQISRLLQRRCLECHRPGEIGPFSLTTYEEAAGWAEMIAEVVREQRMPPWHANAEYGHFINDARLTDEEKALIQDWVAAGAPEGDRAELPPPPEFVEGWRIGEPDLVLYMSDQPYQVPAQGEVRYQYFSVDPGFTEDKWVKAAECRPGNRSVVHHIIVAAAAPEGLAHRVHGDLSSDWLTATAPGARPLILKDGMAKRIPAGSRLIFQMHYTPNGTAQEDRSCVGLVFADPQEVQREVVTQKAATPRFEIPPGAESHRVEASHRFREDTLMLAMFPHMHLRGKAFRYTATYPDGTEEILLDVPRYDFNWQNSYEFIEPKRMPAGTKLTCVAHYDNSENNLANPDPTATVRWGDQTWEEMMIGYFDMTSAKPNLGQESRKRRTEVFLKELEQAGARVEQLASRSAVSALESDAALQELVVDLRQVLPQLDRIDWMTVEEGVLHVRRVTQGEGASGLRVPAHRLRLADYAAGTEVVVHDNVRQVDAPDFKLLGRFYASSLHVPVKIGDVPGVVNFWSAEPAAFPSEAVKLLEPLARVLGPRP